MHSSLIYPQATNKESASQLNIITRFPATSNFLKTSGQIEMFLERVPWNENVSLSRFLSWVVTCSHLLRNYLSRLISYLSLSSRLGVNCYLLLRESLVSIANNLTDLRPQNMSCSCQGKGDLKPQNSCYQQRIFYNAKTWATYACISVVAKFAQPAWCYWMTPDNIGLA